MQRTSGPFLALIAALGLAAGHSDAHAGTLSGVSFAVSNPAPGTNAAITLTFTTQTALTAGDNLILAEFPAGFTLTNGFQSSPPLTFCNANITVTFNNAPESFAALGTTFCGTYSGTGLQINTGISIPAATTVAITLSSAIAQNPSSPGSYTMQSLRTATPSGGTIDAPAALPSVLIGTPPSSIASVPAVSPPGLALLALLLMAAGVLMMRRRLPTRL